MRTLILEKLPRILKAKKILEQELDVKITNNGTEVFINGEAEKEFTAEKVLDALNFGFPFRAAMSITEEDVLFEKLNIKNYTKTKDYKRVRARLIGKGGKVLRALVQLTDCFFEMNQNEIGIIGSAENIKIAQEAVISIIRGAKHANVYSYLEKHQPKEIIDFGLKKED